MSYRALGVAWDAEGLTPGEKLVFVSLADQANDEGVCWPSQSKTAARTGFTRQTVNQHIRSLESKGLVSVVERGQYRMVYQIQMSDILTPQMSDNPTLDVGKSDSRCRESRHIYKPPINHQRTNDTSVEVQKVFSHWQETLDHPRAKLDDKRKRKIAAALKTFSLEDLCLAIDGCAASDFHMGKNDSQTKYDDISLILRDASHIEKFMDGAEDGGRRLV